MWKKSEHDEIVPESETVTSVRSTSFSQQPRKATGEAATIGPSIHIRGDLIGEEDIIVHGRVEGTVSLEQNNLHVGRDGWISADVKAQTIDIEGTVQGELHGGDHVSIRRAGRVQGNISAPRVTLEDGCKFKGSIDMEFDLDEKPVEEPRAKVSEFKHTPKPTATPTSGSADDDSSDSESGSSQAKAGS
jgi:cytoskeletal protein CcmA (bactofilin family)